jgi:uncharacterized membrane protein
MAFNEDSNYKKYKNMVILPAYEKLIILLIFCFIFSLIVQLLFLYEQIYDEISCCDTDNYNVVANAANNNNTNNNANTINYNLGQCT